MAALTLYIESDSDNGYAYARTSTTSGDFAYAGRRSDTDICNTWLRYANVLLPPGATINSAHIHCYATAVTGATVLRMYLVDEDNHIAPTTYAEYSTDAGRRTTAYSSWSFSVTTPGWQQSADFAGAIQEVVNRAGWQSGYAIGVHLSDSSNPTGRCLEQYEYSFSAEFAPYIDIDYSVGTSIPVFAHHYRQHG